MGLRRISEDDVPHLGSASLQTITWSIVSGFKGLENDVVILAALTDIETDWHRGVAYVGMSRARTRLHVVIHEDCDGKRREWEARGGVWRWCCRVVPEPSSTPRRHTTRAPLPRLCFAHSSWMFPASSEVPPFENGRM